MIKKKRKGGRGGSKQRKKKVDGFFRFLRWFYRLHFFRRTRCRRRNVADYLKNRATFWVNVLIVTILVSCIRSFFYGNAIAYLFAAAVGNSTQLTREIYRSAMTDLIFLFRGKAVERVMKLFFILLGKSSLIILIHPSNYVRIISFPAINASLGTAFYGKCGRFAKYDWNFFELLKINFANRY